MKCYVCEDVDLIWGGDHSGEDYGVYDLYWYIHCVILVLEW